MTLIDILLCLLIVAIIAVLIVLTIFLAKMLDELTATLKSVRELTDLTKNEIKPALKSFNEVLATLKNVSEATNKRIDAIRNVVGAIAGGASCLAMATKGKGGFFSGLISGFNMFRKKRS